MRKPADTLTIKGIFTNNVLDATQHMARLYGVSEQALAGILYSRTIAEGRHEPPRQNLVLLPSILPVRGGDSFVSSVNISEKLVEEFRLRRGELVEIEVDLARYAPAHGLHVLRARTDDYPRWENAL